MAHYTPYGWIPERPHSPTFLDGTAECIVCGTLTEHDCPSCNEPVCEVCCDEHRADAHRPSTAGRLSAMVRLNPQGSEPEQAARKGLFPSSREAA